MLATDKQINYLEALQNKVYQIHAEKPAAIRRLPVRRNWREERGRGMTVADASTKIRAYKDILFWAGVSCDLLGRERK